MIGDGHGAVIAAGEDRAIGVTSSRIASAGLNPRARDRRRGDTKKVKIGVEVAAHVVVKSIRKKSQDKPPRKSGV